MAPLSGVGVFACGIAENEAPEGPGEATPPSESASPSNCPPDEMAEAVANAIARTAGETGEPDLSAVRELFTLDTSLAGVECLENLEMLYASSPLPDEELLRLIPLEKLRYISLQGTTSLAPLAQLPQITSLSVSSNDTLASRLSPLAQLPALEELELAGMQHLSGMSPLIEFKSLRSLRVFDVHSAGGADDYSFLAEVALEDLSLNYTAGPIDFSDVDTSRLRSLGLVGVDASNLEGIGPPFGPPAEISLDTTDEFSALYPTVASALCPLGWCVKLMNGFQSTTIDPSCWESCGLSAD